MAADDERAVPPALLEAWELALRHPDPLVAVAATRAVRGHLLDWERELASEALAAGATWEMIGEATGVSRQAAWERFRSRPRTEDAGSGSRYRADIKRLRGEVDRIKRQARDKRRLARDPSRD